MTSKTKKKRVDFSVRPRKEAAAGPGRLGAGRAGGGGQAAQRTDGPAERLTLNLPAAMHTAFKGRCVVEGVTIQDKVQELIRRELEQQTAAAGQGSGSPST